MTTAGLQYSSLAKYMPYQNSKQKAEDEILDFQYFREFKGTCSQILLRVYWIKRATLNCPVEQFDSVRIKGKQEEFHISTVCVPLVIWTSSVEKLHFGFE